MKHVNVEFWQQWAPAIETYAAGAGQRRLLHVRRGLQRRRPQLLSTFTTKGEVQSVARLRLPGRRHAASPPAARATDGLRDFFAADDYYTDADSNAYSLPTFLGNHDMGRIGRFLDAGQPGRRRRRDAGARPARPRADVLLARHAGRLLRRRAGLHRRRRRQGRAPGHGPELRPPSYLDDDQIGTDATPAATTSTRRTRSTARSAELAKLSSATTRPCARGAQLQRYAADGPGVFAFSPRRPRPSASSTSSSPTTPRPRARRPSRTGTPGATFTPLWSPAAPRR